MQLGMFCLIPGEDFINVFYLQSVQLGSGQKECLSVLLVTSALG